MDTENAVNTDRRSSEVLTLPNILSLMRVLLTPVFIWAMGARRPWLSFAVFLLAGATDALDGFTARILRLKTKVGLWLDPLGDKILLTAAFICLTVRPWAVPNRLPVWLTIICVGRDVLIALGSLVYVLIRGRTQFKPSLIGKASTILQVLLLLGVLLANGLGTSPDLLPWLYILTAGLTALAGLQYYFIGIRRFFGPGPSA